MSELNENELSLDELDNVTAGFNRKDYLLGILAQGNLSEAEKNLILKELEELEKEKGRKQR